MWIVAQTDPPPFESAPRISVPKESKPKSDSQVLSPTDPKQGNKIQSVESPAERTKRLQDAGVVPIPTPTPEYKTRLGRDVNRMSEGAKYGDDELAPLGLRMGFDFGSWYPIVPASGTRIIPDFSYGLYALYPLSSQPIVAESYRTSEFVGGGIKFFNSGTFANVVDHTGEKLPVYADANVTELGATYAWLRERRFKTSSHLSWETRVSYYPLRIIRANYKSIIAIPKSSEISSRYMFNTLGFGGHISATYGFARIMSLGLFSSVDMASPFQVRVRVGMTVELSAIVPKPEAPQDPANPNGSSESSKPGPSSPTATPFPMPVPTPEANQNGKSRP